MKHVIVSNSFGNIAIYSATLNNAKSIFNNHLDGLDPKVLHIKKKQHQTYQQKHPLENYSKNPNT